MIVEGDFSEMSGHAAMQRLLSHAPDAVFAFSDSMALGALRALREANVRAPEEVAVVGFDDFPPASQSVPPLTTVRQPTERTGRMAVELFTDIIERPSESCERAYPSDRTGGLSILWISVALLRFLYPNCFFNILADRRCEHA